MIETVGGEGEDEFVGDERYGDAAEMFGYDGEGPVC